MSRTDQLLERYAHFVGLPWNASLAGAQRVWFVVYDKNDERRIRARIDEYAIATKEAGHNWLHCDLTNAFADWMASHDYRDAYFEDPEDLELTLPDFEEHVVAGVKSLLDTGGADSDTVVALSGIASLFGFMRVSALVKTLEPAIRGRLVVFFPGEHENNNYRLLDARDGWNYMAVPITAHEGAGN